MIREFNWSSLINKLARGGCLGMANCAECPDELRGRRGRDDVVLGWNNLR